MKKKVRFIINPFSGVSNKQDIVANIEQLLDKKQFDFEIAYTEYAGHAIILSKTAVQEGFDMVVAVGGDGSVNEVAQSLVNTQTILGIIPAGSGNGFAGHLKISRRPLKAIEVLNTGKSETIDSCTVNDQFFVNAAGVGFDSYVAYKTKLQSARGLKVYIKGTVKEAFRYKSEEYTVIADGVKTHNKYLSITVANGSILGYNFAIAPNASLQDGQLQLIKIFDAPKLSYFVSVWRFWNRSAEKSNLVEGSQCDQVIIESEANNLYYHIDGEGKKYSGSLHFKILPKSLRVWVPQW